jgi:hypothetical protein
MYGRFSLTRNDLGTDPVADCRKRRAILSVVTKASGDFRGQLSFGANNAVRLALLLDDARGRQSRARRGFPPLLEKRIPSQSV